MSAPSLRTSLLALVASALAAPTSLAQVLDVGAGCPGASGEVPRLEATLPHTGQMFFVEVSTRPLALGLLLIGFSDETFGGLPLPYELGFGGCRLLVSGEVQVPFGTDADGEFRLPARGFQPGVTIYAQAYVMDVGPTGAGFGAMSNGLALVGAGFPARGDVIVTEVMQNPASVADALGEWFEVRNLKGTALNLEGWTIADNNASHRIAAGGKGVVVPAFGSLVFGRNGDPAKNGGIAVDYVYGDVLELANATDRIALSAYQGTLIDVVEWDDGATFPDPSGASMSLSASFYDEESNDQGQLWCESTPTIGTFGNTDRGTPGADNLSCPLAF